MTSDYPAALERYNRAKQELIDSAANLKLTIDRESKSLIAGRPLRNRHGEEGRRLYERLTAYRTDHPKTTIKELSIIFSISASTISYYLGRRYKY